MIGIDVLDKFNNIKCKCGKTHSFNVKCVYTGSGVIEKLPEAIELLKAKKCFLISDANTFEAAGKKAINILEKNGIEYVSYSIDEKNVEPNEKSVGAVIMHFDKSCDIVVGIGSGVINDIGKILANLTFLPYIIIATAPSMDGYASATSSMTRDGLKISLPSKCADIIIGDTDVLCNAPLKMLQAGMGDMFAKYISICEWRISSLITGEYYCEEIAKLVRYAVKKCADNADCLLKRDKKAIEAVFEGLIIAGAAMAFAGLSRPASGVEHYFSHVWDMRGLAYGTNVELHGIQCAIATLYASRIYEIIKTLTPDENKALEYVDGFDYEQYKEKLKTFIGKGSAEMIALEKKEQKYSKELHKKRLKIIIKNWSKIVEIIEQEVPSNKIIEGILKKIECPCSIEEIGMDKSILPMTFNATKDIRDKYVLSRLCWDLGIIDDIKFC